ncbi:hypothetical protein [Klebsiella oxytoca]|uniref:hypothetical protein n=1 Tax=Klebsiella oxytoca TaxID=571 RepID=UPI0022B4FDB0|nr:hypothetical protein [Klebsiella oxytoca]MEC5327606.1 hypothetical protein [Klebsiella oxytoca]MEC5357652.1 hypothetical protein [Klebsiella oxytoca]
MTRQHHDDNAHEKLTASHGLSAKGSPGGTRHHTQYKNDDSWKAHFGGPFYWAKKSPLRDSQISGRIKVICKGWTPDSAAQAAR